MQIEKTFLLSYICRQRIKKEWVLMHCFLYFEICCVITSTLFPFLITLFWLKLMSSFIKTDSEKASASQMGCE